ncbi:MAG: hypothetical protein AAGF11_45800 [Myxococcota bacterium]
MPRIGLLGLLGLLAMVGCSDEEIVQPPSQTIPPAVFSEVCGTEGPHRLLPLATGEHAYSINSIPGSDRVLVSTFWVDPQIPLAMASPTLDHSIYAVGPCAEDPIELARGLVLSLPHGDSILACHDDEHGAYELDPTGAQIPRPLLDGWCPLRSTDAGLLTVEVEPEPEQRYGSLVLLRDPPDTTEPEVLAEGIRTPHNRYFGPGGRSTTSLWTAGTEAIGLDENGTVHRFDLTTGEASEEVRGVRELRVSGSGRWMIWQALDPSSGDPEAPVGPVFVRDRETSTDAYLLDTHLEWTGNPYAGEYLVLRDDQEGLSVLRRDGPEPISMPAKTDYRGVIADDRLWLSRRVDGLTEELQWTPGEAEPVVFARHDGEASRRSDGLEIFEADPLAAVGEGHLSFVPWEGGDPVVLADRVHRSRRRLADGRILTITGADETRHGALRLIDPDAGSWVQLDPGGYEQSPRLNDALGERFDGDIIYAIDGRAGDERGVYRARVPR